MGYLLVLEEKYYKYNFYASNEQELHEMCRTIINTRNNEGWYKYIHDNTKNKPIEPIKPVDFENQPIYVHNAYFEQLKEYKESLALYNAACDRRIYLDKALNNGRSAYLFLTQKDNCEIYKIDNIEDYGK